MLANCIAFTIVNVIGCWLQCYQFLIYLITIVPSFNDDEVEMKHQWSLSTNTKAFIHGLPRLVIVTLSLYHIPSVNSSIERYFVENVSGSFDSTTKSKSKTHHGLCYCYQSKVKDSSHTSTTQLLWQHQVIQNTCTMGQIIRALNYMKALCLNVLHSTMPHHYTTSASSRVRDLTSTLWLPINSNIPRKPNINWLVNKSIP